jgi:adenylate cyclase
MRRFLLACVAPAVLLAAVLLRVADPPQIEHLRLAAFDEFLRLKPRPWVEADVRIVDIDDASLERLGQWPWPRPQMAALLDRLGELGAAAVVFDIVFAEPDRTSPDRVLQLWADLSGDPEITRLAGRLPDHDAYLAKSIGAASAVLGMQLTEERTTRRPQVKWGIATAGDDPRPFLPRFSGAVVNIAALENAAAGQGSINSDTDRDGVIRRVPVVVRLLGGAEAGDEIYPSLSAEALRVAQGASTYVLKASGANGVQAFGEHTGLAQIGIGQMRVPVDQHGRMWLYDTGFVRERFIPAWNVLASGFDGARVEGKIVFVGTSAVGLKDIRATPVNPAAAGVELHAQAAEQMILGSYLDRPDWATGLELVGLVVFGLVLTIALPRFGASWCAIIGAVGVLLALTVSWLAFARAGWLIDPVYPSLAAVVLYLAQSFILFLRTEAERQQVRGAFSRYMSPALVERLAKDPSRLRLGGETREMSVLFSDIRGFTAISESLDAETLTRFINRFMTPMTEVILRRVGTIDKYMGDAVMAFWNAPLDDPNHVTHAARAALEMVEALAVFNQQWAVESAKLSGVPHEVGIGIGLNTGPCCVGNMGSEQRFDYSVLGDTVNLASRLEGLSRQYEVPIIIGETTRDRLSGFACLELDLVQVKGKAFAARIYALLGDETVAASAWFQDAEAAQQSLLAAYRRRDWHRAVGFVASLRQAAAGRLDGLCGIYAARIDTLRALTLPPDWDGVFAAVEK